MNTQTFADQVAIVTGAGEGIGFEIARQLALQGASVLLNDINEERASKAAAVIREEGGICKHAGGDVAEVDVVRGLVSHAVEAFGQLHLAVANAGLTHWARFLDYEPSDFNRVISVNLQGSFFFAQAAARQMQKQETGGRIVFMSSVTGHQAVPDCSVYSMTKAGLEMLARHLVEPLAPLGITVNAVAPGAIVTPRNLADYPDYEEIWRELTPVQRAGQPIDIAQAVLFLLSPAARHITGQTLVVDGGWSAISPLPVDESEG